MNEQVRQVLQDLFNNYPQSKFTLLEFKKELGALLSQRLLKSPSTTQTIAMLCVNGAEFDAETEHWVKPIVTKDVVINQVVPSEMLVEDGAISSRDEQHIEYDSSNITVVSNVNKIRVITTIVADETIDTTALHTLAVYCRVNNASLHVFFKGQRNNSKVFASDYEHLFTTSSFDDIQVHLHRDSDLRTADDKLAVLASANINLTAIKPLNHTLNLTKAKYIVIPHPRQELKPSVSESFLTKSLGLSTGCLNTISAGKTRIKAQLTLHAVTGAVIYNPQRDFINIYHVNFDETGFYDLDGRYYHPQGVDEPTEGVLDTLYLDDPHFSLVDRPYFNNIIKHYASLKPLQMVGGDTFNGSSLLYHEQSHFGFQQNRMNFVEELEITKSCIEELLRGAGNKSKYVMLFANHEQFFSKYLAKPSNLSGFDSQELALIYRTLAYIVENTKSSYEGIRYANPFKFLYRELFESGVVDDKAEERFNILLNCHGHEFGLGSLANNGTVKAILGHTHAPQINKGIIHVGAMQIEHPTYHSGVNASGQGCCLLWRNGKRTLAVNL